MAGTIARLPVTLALVLCVTCCSFASCSSKKHDQSTCMGAHSLYSQAQLSGNFEQLFFMIDGDVSAKKELAFTLANIHEINRLIDKLPIVMQADLKNSLKSESDNSLLAAQSQVELFGLIVGKGDTVATSVGLSFQNRFKSCAETAPGSGRYVAISLDGSKIHFVRRSDGLLYVIPSADVLRALNRAYIASQKALDGAKEAIKESSKGPSR